MAEERDKALDMALGQIEKQFGKGSVMRLGDRASMGIEAIPTGALALDLALGIGGLPRGRIVEIFGPESSGKSTLAMHCVAEAQRNGGICAYIDAEHAMDPVYARAIGVNVDDLLISQPDTGEQALEIADMLIRSGALDVIVIDSVAALTPRAEIEGDMGDSHVGLQARLMSQALRKLTATLNKSDTIAVFINQLREKIGVLYGCFSYGTRVVLADGSTEKIGKIVNQRLPVEVLSYDPEVGAVVPKRVVNWFDNGRTDQFLQFTVAKPGGNGRAQFAATANHLIRTPVGWREAKDLEVGDRVMQAAEHRLSPFQWEALRGTLMGDGALSPTRSGHGARLRFCHGRAQVAYADWKASLFANLRASRGVRQLDDAVLYDFQPLAELAELRRSMYVGGKKVLDDAYLKQLTPLSLALWYMDDANFTVRSKGLQRGTAGGSGRAMICVEAMEPASRERLVAHLADTWGIRGTLKHDGPGGKALLRFDAAETAKLQALIAPFVHPSMDYKLLPRFRGRFAVEPQFGQPRYELVAMPVLDIHVKPPTRSMRRFDIEVEGNHNYLVDGVVVHNSPETTPGGRALKFYSSVRLDIRRVETIKDGTEMIGSRTRVKVVKNKCVAAGTKVFDPSTGLVHRIEEIVEQGAGASVMAADKLGKLHVRPIVARMDQGEHEVIGLRLRDGTELRVTADHKLLTDGGWRLAGELQVGDRLARPRRALGFGGRMPMPAEHARMLGYLIGDGCVTGKTPISFTNVEPELQQDAAQIASSLGCDAHVHGIQVFYSHRKNERNQLRDLARRWGIYGCTAPEKRIPAELFAQDVAAEAIGNLIFGIWETDGHALLERTGGIRCGFTSTSEQLAHQLHWLLLRYGIGSSVSERPPSRRPTLIGTQVVQGKLPVFEVRISGWDNVSRFAEALPMWGPKGRKLTATLAGAGGARRRGSQRGYLSAATTAPVLEYLERRGITPGFAACLIRPLGGDPRGGMRQVLGHSRLRRDRMQALADALESEFLHELLDEDVWYDKIVAVSAPEWRRIYDIEVSEDHTFVADDVVVSNCAPPFRQAEFDIMYGTGISREGSLLDVAVDLGFIKKSGAWFTYEGEQLGQGRENVKTFLRENPQLMAEIDDRVRERLAPDQAGDDQPITLDD